jgi:DASS family divalent anion:Na+ symporter
MTGQSILSTDMDHSGSVKALTADPIFGKAPYLGLARLLPYTREKLIAPGEYLYRNGASVTDMFILLEGQVRLTSKNGHELAPASQRLGEEAGTDFSTYLADAVALTPVRVLVIPKNSVSTLFAGVPKLKAEFYFSLMQIFAGEHLHSQAPAKPDAKATAPMAVIDKAPETIVNVLGWLMTLLAPAAILLFSGSWGLDRNTIYFLAIASSTVVMWVFSLVDDYIPAIFAILATLAMQLVPISVVLSGLASDGFMLAMSVLGLGAVIVASGLSYRVLLMLLIKLPNSAFWQNSALLSVGFLLTPLIPSINGRVALVTPFLSDMLEILHHKAKGLAANKLAVSAFTGVSLLSGIFVSSKSVNFVVFGLLPDQVQDQFQWVGWFIAAAMTGLILLVLFAILMAVMFRGDEPAALSKDQLRLQLSLIGKMKQREWAAVIGVVIFMLGVLTTSMHKIGSPWLGMSILFGILLFGALNKNEFREKIDWPFLMYLGGIVGLTSAINYLGLVGIIAGSVPWLGEYMHTNFSMFILLLCAVVFVIRLAVPISATIAMLATVLMPVAVHYGVNPWVVGFIILMVGEMWFLPYQCSYYIQYRQLTKGMMFDERVFLKFNALSNLTKIAAIYASLPYWKSMGML